MIRVVIADDHEVVRSGFAFIINAQPDMEVVGDAADGEQAYQIVSRERPDVLLLDISMPPGESGLVACERFARDFPDMAVLVLTMFSEADYVFFALRSGALGYVLKSASTDMLIDAIHAVAKGEVYVQEGLDEALAGKLVAADEVEVNPYHALSSREIEVMSLLARGYTNKEISERIFVSVKTVESHRRNIYAKLGISTRAELFHIAAKHHLLV